MVIDRLQIAARDCRKSDKTALGSGAKNSVGSFGVPLKQQGVNVRVRPPKGKRDKVHDDKNSDCDAA